MGIDSGTAATFVCFKKNTNLSPFFKIPRLTGNTSQQVISTYSDVTTPSKNPAANAMSTFLIGILPKPALISRTPQPLVKKRVVVCPVGCSVFCLFFQAQR